MIPWYLFFFMLVSLSLLIYTKHNSIFIGSIILKTVTSSFFIAICIFSGRLHQVNPEYFFCILIALSFSFLGDIFLVLTKDMTRGNNDSFLGGLICFTFAHVFFTLGFMYLMPLALDDLLPFLIISPILLILPKLIKGFKFKSMYPFVVFYIMVLSLMFTKAMSVLKLWSINHGSILIASGAGLFFISDIILSFIYFQDKDFKNLVPLNLITYYLGQGLIALSVLYF